MKCAENKSAPYRDEMDSTDEQFARVYLSGIAAIVAEGKENRKTFKKAIILAAEMAGVPVNVMSAHGEVTLVMIAGMMQNQDSPRLLGVVTMTNVNTAIHYSRGKDKFDNCLDQRTCNSFDEFETAVISDLSQRKGKAFITLSLGSRLALFNGMGGSTYPPKMM